MMLPDQNLLYCISSCTEDVHVMGLSAPSTNVLYNRDSKTSTDRNVLQRSPFHRHHHTREENSKGQTEKSRFHVEREGSKAWPLVSAVPCTDNRSKEEEDVQILSCEGSPPESVISFSAEWSCAFRAAENSDPIPFQLSSPSFGPKSQNTQINSVPLPLSVVSSDSLPPKRSNAETPVSLAEAMSGRGRQNTYFKAPCWKGVSIPPDPPVPRVHSRAGVSHNTMRGCVPQHSLHRASAASREAKQKDLRLDSECCFENNHEVGERDNRGTVLPCPPVPAPPASEIAVPLSLWLPEKLKHRLQSSRPSRVRTGNVERGPSEDSVEVHGHESCPDGKPLQTIHHRLKPSEAAESGYGSPLLTQTAAYIAVNHTAEFQENERVPVSRRSTAETETETLTDDFSGCCLSLRGTASPFTPRKETLCLSEGREGGNVRMGMGVAKTSKFSSSELCTPLHDGRGKKGQVRFVGKSDWLGGNESDGGTAASCVQGKPMQREAGSWWENRRDLLSDHRAVPDHVALSSSSSRSPDVSLSSFAEMRQACRTNIVAEGSGGAAGRGVEIEEQSFSSFLARPLAYRVYIENQDAEENKRNGGGEEESFERAFVKKSKAEVGVSNGTLLKNLSEEDRILEEFLEGGREFLLSRRDEGEWEKKKEIETSKSSRRLESPPFSGSVSPFPPSLQVEEEVKKVFPLLSSTETAAETQLPHIPTAEPPPVPVSSHSTAPCLSHSTPQRKPLCVPPTPPIAINRAVEDPSPSMMIGVGSPTEDPDIPLQDLGPSTVSAGEGVEMRGRQVKSMGVQEEQGEPEGGVLQNEEEWKPQTDHGVTSSHSFPSVNAQRDLLLSLTDNHTDPPSPSESPVALPPGSHSNEISLRSSEPISHHTELPTATQQMPNLSPDSRVTSQQRHNHSSTPNVTPSIASQKPTNEDKHVQQGPTLKVSVPRHSSIKSSARYRPLPQTSQRKAASPSPSPSPPRFTPRLRRPSRHSLRPTRSSSKRRNAPPSASADQDSSSTLPSSKVQCPPNQTNPFRGRTEALQGLLDLVGSLGLRGGALSVSFSPAAPTRSHRDANQLASEILPVTEREERGGRSIGNLPPRREQSANTGGDSGGLHGGAPVGDLRAAAAGEFVMVGGRERETERGQSHCLRGVQSGCGGRGGGSTRKSDSSSSRDASSVSLRVQGSLSSSIESRDRPSSLGLFRGKEDSAERPLEGQSERRRVRKSPSCAGTVSPPCVTTCETESQRSLVHQQEGCLSKDGSASAGRNCEREHVNRFDSGGLGRNFAARFEKSVLGLMLSAVDSALENC
uniref:Uncharacterized protein n=1 Tax=Chromera velia CCMP2878 TaxID=1169474 RepID=A0A0G4FPZ6_9ALVE|eukprot:Cvel_3590.t1-p1 / transcript=Cvel_3590.t1 / gene=Cvel_3590 / organism=Chromera_velia_CCMP2878 / gene_product=hypothetical protein / transcript_product=hypothetical protein / location=Cvel_scaffold147:16880-20773(-) / protein_length=1298 / sequence_SO=supercontig / SO=protein_coding / is_pseudo=false